MSDPIKIEVELDIDDLKDFIENSKDLNDNKELFSYLSKIEVTKKKIEDILDQVKKVHDEAKGLINSKGNALYGESWGAIKGNGYKISKSPTGSVFSITGKVMSKFKVVKESIDTKVVETYIKDKGKLPSGVDYNPTRGHSIRITVHDNK